MAAALKSVLPSHLSPNKAEGEGGFEKKHHGKTQSHMVSHIASRVVFAQAMERGGGEGWTINPWEEENTREPTDFN